LKLHILFLVLTSAAFFLQPLFDLQHSIFGYLLFLASVYSGRWIGSQSHGASAMDMLRMFFLGFLILDFGGLAIFARYVEPGLRITHYFESLINISVITGISLFSSFFCKKVYARKRNITSSAEDEKLRAN
jgi:hypothetical protein